MSRRRPKPDYDEIAQLEANLDPDGDGLFQGPLAENIPPPEPPPMTATEATERLTRLSLRVSHQPLAALAQMNGYAGPQGEPVYTYTEIIRAPIVYASASASYGPVFAHAARQRLEVASGYQPRAEGKPPA